MSERKNRGLGEEARRGAKFGAITGCIAAVAIIRLDEEFGTGARHLLLLETAMSVIISAAIAAILFALASAANSWMNSRASR